MMAFIFRTQESRDLYHRDYVGRSCGWLFSKENVRHNYGHLPSQAGHIEFIFFLALTQFPAVEDAVKTAIFCLLHVKIALFGTQIGKFSKITVVF